MHLDPEVRFRARRELEEYRAATPACRAADQLAPHRVLKALRARPALLRWRAARSAAAAVDFAPMADLVSLLREESDAWVRAELVRAIGQRAVAHQPSTACAVAALRRSISDPDGRVRANAVEALVALEPSTPRELLQPLMEGPDHRARAAALVAVGRHDTGAVLPRVWQLVVSADERLRTSGEYVVRSLRPFWRHEMPGAAGIAPTPS